MNIAMEIYRILLDHSGIMTTKALASRLGMKSDRLLRGKGTDMGEIERAKAYAFREHRRLIITTHSGIQIVDDPGVAEKMISKRYRHWTNEQRSMNKDRIRINHLRSTVQGNLFTSAMKSIDATIGLAAHQVSQAIAKNIDDEV